MTEQRELLRHMLSAIAYRLQKALRGAPSEFADYRPAADVRNAKELVRHIDSVLGYARTFFIGGAYHPDPLPTLDQEMARFHETLARLSETLSCDAFDRISAEQLLQGPMSDAMTHVGQIALRRRLFGSPVPPENFVFATMSVDNLSTNQAEPNAPDEIWQTPDGVARRMISETDRKTD